MKRRLGSPLLFLEAVGPAVYFEDAQNRLLKD